MKKSHEFIVQSDHWIQRKCEGISLKLDEKHDTRKRRREHNIRVSNGHIATDRIFRRHFLDSVRSCRAQLLCYVWWTGSLFFHSRGRCLSKQNNFQYFPRYLHNYALQKVLYSIITHFWPIGTKFIIIHLTDFWPIPTQLIIVHLAFTRLRKTMIKFSPWKR